MKTMTDNHIETALRTAMERRAAKVPSLPDDFAQQVMNKMNARKENANQHRVSIPLHYGRLGSLEQPLNVAAAPQRGANPHSRRRARMEGASQQPAVVKPKRTPKRKRVVPQEPQEEPLLAEAETVEEFPTEAAYQEFLDKMRKPSTSSYATQTQEIRERGEQVTQYVAMLNQQIRAEQQYVEY